MNSINLRFSQKSHLFTLLIKINYKCTYRVPHQRFLISQRKRFFLRIEILPNLFLMMVWIQAPSVQRQCGFLQIAQPPLDWNPNQPIAAIVHRSKFLVELFIFLSLTFIELHYFFLLNFCSSNKIIRLTPFDSLNLLDD